MPKSKFDLTKTTIREIHRIILDTQSLKEASIYLGISTRTLQTYLPKSTYIDSQGISKVLTYSVLKKVLINETKAQRALGNRYDQPISIVTGDQAMTTATSDQPMNDVTDNQAMTSTRYDQSILTDDDQPMLIDPHQAMTNTKVDITKKTLREIHKVILASQSLHDAASRLGLSSATLQRHLAKTTYINSEGNSHPLTYEAMRMEWNDEEEGQAAWKEMYDKPIVATTVDITKRTMREIHKIILASKSLRDAAAKLAISSATLQRHLGKSIYMDSLGEFKPLTYDVMKKEWRDEIQGQLAWGVMYDQPMSSTPVNIATRTMREIHKAILASSSLYDAAAKLGIANTTLLKHLSKCTYTDYEGNPQLLTYDAMKTIWPDEEQGCTAWGVLYDQSIPTTITSSSQNTTYDQNNSNLKVDITKRTMREIHKIILASKSIREAASQLGIHDNTLKSHLGKTNYIDSQNDFKPLTFDAMKLEWPSEETGYETWRDAYDQPMIATKVDITKKTMRAIHKIILISKSLRDAAGQLGIRDETLCSHLGKSTYIDSQGETKPLTYEVMKTEWPNEAQAQAAWGDAYDQPMIATKIDLTKKTMREIHKIILASSSLKNAAGQLGTQNVTLRSYLSKSTYIDSRGETKPLTYEVMKTEWPDEAQAQAAWGDAYDQPMINSKVKITNRTMREIHKIILESKSLRDAANKLGVKDETFRSHLGKTIYIDSQGNDQPLTYEVMRLEWLNEFQGEAAWGNAYDQPMIATKVDITKKTMKEIHRIILASKSLNDAAGQLGIASTTLQSHLGKSTYVDILGNIQPLTYDAMQTEWLSEEQGYAAWRDAYDLPIVATTFDITKRTLREIHRIILTSKSLKDAAGKLGMISTTLQGHLGKSTYVDILGHTQPLTYEVMKTEWSSEEQGYQAWKDAYDQPLEMTRVDSTKKTMRDIHKIIIASQSLYDAATKLGVHSATLRSHLGKSVYVDILGDVHPLTYEIMKTEWLSEEQGHEAWGDAYDQPMITTAVDITKRTIREIHKIIITSNSKTVAAGNLGTSFTMLQRHLSKFTYMDGHGNSQPLTYEAMLTEWRDERQGHYAWGESYDQPLLQLLPTNSKVNLEEVTYEESELSLDQDDQQVIQEEVTYEESELSLDQDDQRVIQDQVIQDQVIQDIEMQMVNINQQVDVNSNPIEPPVDVDSNPIDSPLVSPGGYTFEEIESELLKPIIQDNQPVGEVNELGDVNLQNDSSTVDQDRVTDDEFEQQLYHNSSQDFYRFGSSTNNDMLFGATKKRKPNDAQFNDAQELTDDNKEVTNKLPKKSKPSR